MRKELRNGSKQPKSTGAHGRAGRLGGPISTQIWQRRIGLTCVDPLTPSLSVCREERERARLRLLLGDLLALLPGFRQADGDRLRLLTLPPFPPGPLLALPRFSGASRF